VSEELLGLSLLVLVGKVLGDLTERAGYGRLIGEITGGALLGPYAIGGLINGLLKARLFYIGSEIVFLSEFSMILLVFAAGLDHGTAPLRRAGLWGALGAVFGAVTPFALSLALMKFGLVNGIQALFIGASVAPTSLAVVSGMLHEKANGRFADFLFSAAALDDVVSLIILSVAMGVSQLGSSFSALAIIRTTVYYSVAWIIIYYASVKLIPFLVSALGRRYAVEASLVVLFGLIAAMQSLGFSPVIAAFIAGVTLAETVGVDVLRDLYRSLLLVFGSVFFVVTGAQLDPRAVGLQGLALATVILALALIGKAAGALPFAYAYTRDLKESTSAAVAMEPRGEVGLAVASIGLSIGILSQELYGSLVLAIALTTVIGAAAFAKLYRAS